MICGGDANDTVFGRGGNDRLLGDSLNGGPDADLCTGDRGIDTATACERLATVP